MKMKTSTMFWCTATSAFLLGSALAIAAGGQSVQPVTAQLPPAPPLTATPVLEIKADQIKGKVSPFLYGLMTENINYCYDGGLYAEQIRNRNFKELPGERVSSAPTARRFTRRRRSRKFPATIKNMRRR